MSTVPLPEALVFPAVSLLLLAVCVLPAAGKLLGHPKMGESAVKFGIPWRRYRLIAVPELVAAAGVLVGLFWRPAGLLAAAGMTVLLLGALIAHRRVHDHIPDMLPALVALVIAVAYQAIAYAS
jgi:DoxX-like family